MMTKQENTIEFVTLVKTRLLEVEMTQKELSEIVGLKPYYLYGILQGRRKGYKHREKIRATLGLPSVRENLKIN